MQSELGDKPHDVLCSAAEEVLSIVKNENSKVKDRQREVEKLLRRGKPMDDDSFSRLFNIIQKITDFNALDGILPFLLCV